MISVHRSQCPELAADLIISSEIPALHHSAVSVRLPEDQLAKSLDISKLRQVTQLPNSTHCSIAIPRRPALKVVLVRNSGKTLKGWGAATG